MLQKIVPTDPTDCSGDAYRGSVAMRIVMQLRCASRCLDDTYRSAIAVRIVGGRRKQFL
jgi:hypothetical protein